MSILYFLSSSFLLETPLVFFEILLGTYFLVEYVILFSASKNKVKYIKHPLALSNILIIVGYLAAPFWNVGFIRALRTFRVIQLYQIIPDIRVFTRKIIFQEKILALFIHLSVLIFIVTEIVFFLQQDVNESINTRFDAFYFTTNAIAKVGNGETIQLVGTEGKILTLVIALLSLSVFFQVLDTMREYRRIGRREKGQNNDIPDDEIYSEQMCLFCDMKKRGKIDGPKKRTTA